MRGSKEEERLRSPMFPRLHVNDTEKGGPRAPPRNKMALYEQLCIPSQRLSSGNNESSLVSSMSMSSSQAGVVERSVFNSFCNSAAPTHSENSFSPYSGRVELSTKMAGKEQKAVNSPYDQSLNPTQPLPSSAKGNTFQSHNSNFKHFSRKSSGDEDDIRALNSAQSKPLLHYSNREHSEGRENQPHWNLSFSMQFQNISERQKSEFGITNLQARESLSNHTEESRKISYARQDPRERSKILADSSVSPSGKVLSTESSKRAHDRGKVESLKRARGVNDQPDRDFVSIEETTVHQGKSLLEFAAGIRKNNAPKVTNESFTKSSPNVDKRSHNIHEGRKHGSLQVVNVQTHNLSPDDVVKLLGEKQFWKARKAIVDQQRTFGVQVFELHRLIKVQKLIAESPNLLLEGNIYLRKTVFKSSPVPKVPPLQAKQQPLPIAKSIDNPSVQIENNKELIEKSKNESTHSANARPSQWFGEWLVPVMSPSEGLVYKPFTAQCHPNAGYMAPVYSNFAPPSFTAERGDFLNAVYGVPTSHQYGQTYFPPCGMPIMASSISGSAVEQSSCNMSSQMSRTIPRRIGNVQASKESEIQGSTASSLPPMPKELVLPLFPTEPTSKSSDRNARSNEQQTHVIKVIPHNRKLATESAARIFHSLTEERKQCF